MENHSQEGGGEGKVSEISQEGIYLLLMHVCSGIHFLDGFIYAVNASARCHAVFG